MACVLKLVPVKVITSPTLPLVGDMAVKVGVAVGGGVTVIATPWGSLLTAAILFIAIARSPEVIPCGKVNLISVSVTEE